MANRSRRLPEHTLKKIARTLSLSTDAFFDFTIDKQSEPSALEEAELLQLFRKVRSSQVREHFLSFLRALE